MQDNQEIAPEIAQAIHDYFERLANNQCVTCGAPLTKKVQIARCVYGEPCGHKQYQGTLSKGEQHGE